MRLLALLLMMLTTMTAEAAIPQCATSGVCEMGTTCICTVSPDSSHDRYFYIQFNGMDKGHVYQCKMSNSMGLTFLVATAKVPDGGSLTCQGSCQRFPVTLVLDARELVKPTDSMQVKYFVPGNDMATDLHTRCDVVN
jgi:hypothetical protein